MEYSKEQLLKERVFYHFYQICQIPHPSGGEKALSDFIFGWAKEQGLDARQDEINNVFIRKPASPGYEKAPGVMLQAHIDMVCEKAVDSPHDFTKDPIPWVIEGDILSTGGKTTLGADDGIGVASAMAVLEDDTLLHPELEVLFTVSEESDFTGADGFDASQMKSEYLINLDHACDHEILCGSCGGIRAEIKLPLSPTSLPEGWETYTLTVSGLKGGHSGEDIHRGHGNANVILARVMMEAEKNAAFGISGVKGGTYRLAIPRDAVAWISMNPSDVPAMQKLVAEQRDVIGGELKETGDLLEVKLEPAKKAEFYAAPEKIISLLLLAPDGIAQMNEVLTGLVDASDNMGELHMDREYFRAIFEIRSAQASARHFIYAKIRRLAQLLGAESICDTEYPSWDFKAHSKLREVAVDIYKKSYQEEPSVLALHAGLEVGYLYTRKPSIDVIALGPDCWNFHSPSERVSISSTKKTYEFLCNILAGIH